MSLPLDVTDHEAAERVIQQAAEHYGRLDVLVNNAGWSKIEPVAEMSLETWQRCIDVDLTGTFSGMHHALPIMIAQGGGAIVNRIGRAPSSSTRIAYCLVCPS